ncbi:MAG: gliding motility-associated C-terminal domain-containing protein [Bacteroidales bacterium]
MTGKNTLTALLLSFFVCFSAFPQGTSERPEAPVFTFLTIDSVSGKPYLEWQKSPSADVAGYIIYNWIQAEAHAIDTVWNPAATSYINSASKADFWSESYVIAAIDSTGNVSPLTGVLNTIFPALADDPCNGAITVIWNTYSQSQSQVNGYTIMLSESGGPFQPVLTTGAETTSASVKGIKSSINNCFRVRADLPGGNKSNSVFKCRTVDFQKIPEWMNADYASISSGNHISLSFTFDPASEINIYRISRKTLSDNSVAAITSFNRSGNNITYTDLLANTKQRYEYTLVAVNDCGLNSAVSNPAGNIVLQTIYNNGYAGLSWNSYVSFSGGVRDYRLYTDKGSGFSESQVIPASDTSFAVDYSQIMNEVTGAELCFYVEAFENTNQYGISGISRSNTVCIPVQERITVPNAFTPDNDNINDIFRPVLSFTPSDYRLIITDRQNNRLFETTDHLLGWDGTKGGDSLPRDVYVWYLSLKTPSGQRINRTGTVTIVKTR